MAEKIVQTAGRNALGEFAPEFAHFNDDVLFGENWNNEDLPLKTRSLITVVALMAQGITDSSRGTDGQGSLPEFDLLSCGRAERCLRAVF